MRNDLRRCSGSKSSLEGAREHRIPSPASSTPRSSLRALVPASRLLVRLNHILADLEATGIVAQLCIRAELRRRKDGQPSSQAAPSVPRTHARTEARHTSCRRAPREAKPTKNYSMGAQNEEDLPSIYVLLQMTLHCSRLLSFHTTLKTPGSYHPLLSSFTRTHSPTESAFLFLFPFINSQSL